MPNTTIQLKKSSTPSAVPADLANGELAINFADGKLFYKNTAGFIAQFTSGGNFFGTINAAGTLVVADTTGDVVSLIAGSGISISGDAINDTITISATGGGSSVAVSNVAPGSPTANSLWWNSDEGKLYIYYNDGDSSQWVEASPTTYSAGGGSGGGSGTITVNTDAVNSTRYLTFSDVTSGTLTTANVTSGLTFNPSSNTLSINGTLSAVTKSFVIKHPTKANKTLRYGSLEGPENGVYFRGKLSGESIIYLPEYWWNLIDEHSITVHITPYGKKQDLWVQSVSAYHIFLNQPADCFFTVFAERKDVDKLIVEY